MRLILRFQVTDGCTYHCTEVLPVTYESAEALLVDFMDAAKAALMADGSFTFLKHEFSADAFYERVDGDCRGTPEPGYVKRGTQLYFEHGPDVLTLEEFYAEALKQGADHVD